MIEEFFQDIDRRWRWKTKERINLRLIGCSALSLQTDYRRGTKDSDILETKAITPDIENRLLKLAGPHTNIHRRHGLYIQFIKEAIPFIPQMACYHEMRNLNNSLINFSIGALDVVDVVVSKLKTFRPQDVDDIRAMTEKGLVTNNKLVERFRAAVDRWLIDARAADLPKYIENLHTIQRDILLVEETHIELPEWV